MTPGFAMTIFMTWGLPGLMAVIIGWLVYLVFKYKTAFTREIERLHGKVESQNGSCKFHKEYQDRTDKRLSDLEHSSIQTDRDMKTVFKKLDGMDEKLDRQDGKLDNIIFQFAKKGMDA